MGKAVVSDEEILERFRGIVANSLRIDPASITPDAYLDDLGAESLDLLEVTIESENAFHVLVPETNILDAATQVFGQGVLQKDGFLTEQGVQLLQRRMPDFDVAAYAGAPVPVADIRRAFLRVSAWVRLIRFLVDGSPTTCTTCGAALVPGTPGRMKCDACGVEYDIPTGDALNRTWIERYHREHDLAAAAPPGAASQASER